MTDYKRPFHEVLSHKLVFAPIGLTTDASSERVSEIMTILDVLERSHMKASDAHKIAEDHAGLPDLLRSVGQNALADCAEEVLADLKAREDEVPEEAEAVAAE